MRLRDMSVERGQFGGWRISAMHNGYRVSRLYIEYTKREAIAEFRAEMKRHAG